MNEDYNAQFNNLKCCVIIPTYNNCTTLEKVIDGVLHYTNNLIVVNDGSTDDTLSIIKKYDNVEIISYAKNKGKGFALKRAFEKAIEKGYRYAITIDSDGQHDPEEIIKFINEIEKDPDILIIGSRNFNKDSVIKKNNFANKFSNFWFRFFTNCDLPDTQSGYRLYPLELLKKIKLRTGKYEFEFEILVRSAWKGIKIISIPICVYYPPPEKRISHFRPFSDFTRISLLNTIFFFITVLYIKPYNFFKNFNRKTIKDFYKNNILASDDSNAKIIASVMFGIFMGIVPIWGYQLITAIALAYILKLNKLIVIIAANISIVPMIPVILYFSYVTGGFFMNTHSYSIARISDFSFAVIKENIIQYIVGSFIFAILLSLSFGIVTFVLLRIFRKSEIN
jgi:glycosyltransferase involved in cell wall biosynthesis